MNKWALGSAVIAVGVIMLLAANYITMQVGQGRSELESGQRRVDSTNSLFSTNPYSKVVGKQITGSGQARINAGYQEVSQYESIANKLEIGGLIVIVVGVGIFFIYKRKK